MQRAMHSPIHRGSLPTRPASTLHPSKPPAMPLLTQPPTPCVAPQVSLFPTENVEKGKGLMNPWPFRQDLLDALKALKPA